MDLVSDILDRVSVLDGVDNNMLDEIEKQVRIDWGGDRPYIAKNGNATHVETSMRNQAMYADSQKGEGVELLMRRYQVSRARVYQILALFKV